MTLFHEFGHLVHHVLGGRQEWVRFSGVATEWDFVEAPSQMLEEWAWDADVLRPLRHATPTARRSRAALVERMRAAHEFGKALDVRTQMFYAAISYHLHAEVPGRPRRAGGRAAGDATTSSRTVPGHPLPGVLRPPGRLHLGLLHLHVVAR